MLSVVNSFPDYQFVIAAAPTFTPAYYEQIMGGNKAKLVFSATYQLLNVAHAALVASGTATLETALFKVPQVVLYKGGAISVGIARMVIKIRFISLVNLIMDKKVVTELIQQDCNPKEVASELELILTGNGRAEQLASYEILHEKMGKAGASERTAALIVRELK
jgi:lipid-A-disaccharide synthase